MLVLELMLGLVLAIVISVCDSVCGCVGAPRGPVVGDDASNMCRVYTLAVSVYESVSVIVVLMLVYMDSKRDNDNNTHNNILVCCGVNASINGFEKGQRQQHTQ
jgi:hypothetical protein